MNYFRGSLLSSSGHANARKTFQARDTDAYYWKEEVVDQNVLLRQCEQISHQLENDPSNPKSNERSTLPELVAGITTYAVLRATSTPVCRRPAPL